MWSDNVFDISNDFMACGLSVLKTFLECGAAVHFFDRTENMRGRYMRSVTDLQNILDSKRSE